MLLRDCIYMCREVGTANSIFTGLGHIYECKIQLYTLRLDQIYTKSMAQIWYRLLQYNTSLANYIHE